MIFFIGGKGFGGGGGESQNEHKTIIRGFSRFPSAVRSFHCWRGFLGSNIAEVLYV